ncbi:unnamed protein product [Phytophthora lilii]|uniref:Unnamed protein product n=1 Tax=Phytophthora lilii TaxID=2077276 RepID=A0A9W7CN32_9STRA|nr:unnamed protein product [Phytophthora lilii]
MLSTKTFVKLLVVAVALSDFILSTYAAKPTECHVVDSSTPSPTTPSDHGIMTGDKSTVEGSSGSKTENTQPTNQPEAMCPAA